MSTESKHEMTIDLSGIDDGERPDHGYNLFGDPLRPGAECLCSGCHRKRERAS